MIKYEGLRDVIRPPQKPEAKRSEWRPLWRFGALWVALWGPGVLV